MRRRALRQWLVWAGLAVALLYFLAPIAWLLLSSVQPEGDLTAVPPHWIPKTFTLENFQSFINPALRARLALPGVASDVGSSLLHSTVIAASVTVSNLLLGVPAAYTFARMRGRVLSLGYLALLVMRMVPAVAIVIPFYLTMRNLGLIGSYPSVILAHSAFTLPLVVWILRGFFVGIPPDLEDAARIDGCTRLGALWRVIMPLVTPGLVSAAVYAFMFSWNEFFFSLVLTAATHIKTVPVVAALFASDIMLKYGVMNAAAVVAVIPPVVLTILFSRYLRKGLVTGALK
ncbi:MAG: carbohydrate ABC transporter permease [Deinococcales bacterium]|jgi:multiple sugar transport system permease protein